MLMTSYPNAPIATNPALSKKTNPILCSTNLAENTVTSDTNTEFIPCLFVSLCEPSPVFQLDGFGLLIKRVIVSLRVANS